MKHKTADGAGRKGLPSMSLRNRITLLFTILLVMITGILTWFSILNNVRTITAVPMRTIDLPAKEIEPGASIEFSTKAEKSKETTISQNEIDEIGSAFSYEPAKKEAVPMVLVEAKRSFRDQQLVFMALTILVGSVAVYWLVGRALRPLTSLSERIAEIDACRLDAKLPASGTNDELSSLIRSFNSMLSRLETSFSAQKNFAANAAHELKTPLATMKASLQVLRLGDGPTAEESGENALLMENQVERLTEIVSNLLLLTSTQGDFRDQVRADELAEDLLTELEPEISEKNLIITRHLEPATLYGDGTLLRAAVRNVLSNAVKYNRPGGKVKITVSALGDGCRIGVSDTGGGVDPSALPHIFEPLYRADSSRSKRIEGNGLGLAIVKTVMDKHHGEILLDNRPGEGLEITLCFVNLLHSFGNF